MLIPYYLNITADFSNLNCELKLLYRYLYYFSSLDIRKEEFLP
jgi:hypothetical protein